jgi:hypothetical protein
MKKLMTILLITMMTGISANPPDRLKPYALRHKFDRGFGDRYYTGVPAYHYEHLWPEWKREIWYTIGDWSSEEIPQWVAYYDYPYIVWPNFYRYFGSPYYTRSQRQKHLHAKQANGRSIPAAEDAPF